MILYFSGTGNSAYAAKRIGKEINDEVINLFDKIKNNKHSEMTSKRPWVVVVPTYAWRIPHIVRNWLENTNLVGNKDMYFVMTCGGNIGNAGKYLESLCTEKGMHYCGCEEIKMPENYIAMFTPPSEQEALQIIEQAEAIIDNAAAYIRNGEKFPRKNISFGDKISSGIVNDLFYPVFVHAKKFYAVEHCISCGQCADVCPLSNIQIEKGKPVWGQNCTHCMACICRCPKEAIEYGNHSHGLPRYICKKEV